MPATAQSIVDAANAEWVHWGSPRWNCITNRRSGTPRLDDERAYAEYVRDTYCGLFFKSPVTWPTVEMIADDQYYWSAVTISYVMRQAGFLKPEFPISQSHSTYLRWGIAARRANERNAAYWGYRVDEANAKPDVGDLVGYARSKTPLSDAQRLAYFDRTGAYDSHSDIVVAKRAGEIDVIGGNVLDSVTKKTLALNASGQLADQRHNWFVVLKLRV